MVNKKTIVAGLLIVFAIMAVVVVVSTKSPTVASDITVPNAKAPPEVQPTSEQTTVQTLTLSDGTNTGGVTCQQPPNGNEYGGIGGTESNPPKGTAIGPELTVQYGRPTATGVCGTYWYVVGWWFNASEMAKLPADTLLYGISPYAMTTGSDDGSDNDDRPVIPVPEVATIVMVALGVLTLLVWNKQKK